MISKFVIWSVDTKVQQTCGSHGDKQLSIVPGLLVGRCVVPTKRVGLGEIEGDGRVFQVTCITKVCHSRVHGCWVDACDVSKYGVGRYVWGGGWGIERCDVMCKWAEKQG